MRIKIIKLWLYLAYGEVSMSLFSANNLVGVYSILIGVMIIGVWIFLLSTKKVPELKPSSYAPRLIAYHIVAELLTAILLIISGVGFYLVSDWAKMLSAISLGMLLYSVINSPGKYAHENNLLMVTMFAIITILTVAIITSLFLLI